MVCQKENTIMKIINYISVSSLLLTFSFGIFAQDNNLKSKFEELFPKWKESILTAQPESKVSSRIRFDNSNFKEIVKLGVPILPLAIDKLKKNDDWVGMLIPEITKTRIDSQFDKEKGVYVFEDYPDFTYKPQYLRGNGETAKNIWVYWWEKGRKKTPELFAKKYANWKSAIDNGKPDETKKRYQDIQNLGIVALPEIVDKIKSGQKRLIPMFSYLVDNNVKETASPEECLKWWEDNKKTYAEVINY